MAFLDIFSKALSEHVRRKLETLPSVVISIRPQQNALPFTFLLNQGGVLSRGTASLSNALESSANALMAINVEKTIIP